MQVLACDTGPGDRMMLALGWVQSDALQEMLGASDSDRTGFTSVLRVLATFYRGERAHPLAPAHDATRARMQFLAQKVRRTAPPPPLQDVACPRHPRTLPLPPGKSLRESQSLQRLCGWHLRTAPPCRTAQALRVTAQ